MLKVNYCNLIYANDSQNRTCLWFLSWNTRLSLQLQKGEEMITEKESKVSRTLELVFKRTLQPAAAAAAGNVSPARSQPAISNCNSGILQLQDPDHNGGPHSSHSFQRSRRRASRESVPTVSSAGQVPAGFSFGQQRALPARKALRQAQQPSSTASDTIRRNRFMPPP